jgi:hypothetical protein
MTFVIKYSSKPYWSLETNNNLIKNIYISKTNFYIKFLIWFRIEFVLF